MGVLREVVLGPPGTGKTETLLGMVEEELRRGVEPERIGYISFTRRAAREAAERAASGLGLPPGALANFSTIHSLCFHRLGLSTTDVLEGPRLQEFADWAGVQVSGRLSLDDDFPVQGTGDKMLFLENLARIRCVPLRDLYNSVDVDIPWRDVERVSVALRQWKERCGLLDYTDMLDCFIASGVSVPLDVLLVDEAQDLSALQWRVVDKLAQGCRRVVVAGDDDQAIYRWAGADVDKFVSMDGQVRVLGQSYRVPRLVQQLSSRVIAQVGHRRAKAWQPRAEQGEVSRTPDFADVDTSGEDVLVLARNSYILRRSVEPLLRQEGVIYERAGRMSVPMALLTVVTTWEALRRGDSVRLGAAREVCKWMSAGVGIERGKKGLPGLGDDEDMVDMATLRARGGLLTDAIWHEALDRLPPEDMSYILAARRRGESLQRARVRLSTIHGAKGGQADHVVLMTEQARRTAEEARHNPDDEARVWYVGITRAKRALTVVGTRSTRYFSL